MNKRICLVDAKHEGDRVKLVWSDETEFYVTKDDYERATGPIICGDKKDIYRDFAIKD